MGKKGRRPRDLQYFSERFGLCKAPCDDKMSQGPEFTLALLQTHNLQSRLRTVTHLIYDYLYFLFSLFIQVTACFAMFSSDIITLYWQETN